MLRAKQIRRNANAARFAAKEAGMKAIGTGWRSGVTWKDFEVVNERSGQPTLRLSGVALEISAMMGVERISISLTHTAETAFAIVILENGKYSTGLQFLNALTARCSDRSRP